MNFNERAHYLQLTLWEQKAARNSVSADERKRHEELAITYEMRCLLKADSNFPDGAKKIERTLPPT